MPTFRRVTFWTLCGIGLLILGYLGLLFGPSFIQPLYLPKLQYDIPNGYQGWVQFEVSNRDCGPLPRESRLLIYVVDAKGHGWTSDPIAEGWRTVHYKYLLPNGQRQNLAETGWGKGGLIWDEMYEIQGSRKTYVFFVGTEQQFQSAASSPIH